MPPKRLPARVRFWFTQFLREGEAERAALYHAINRANESGDISDATADRLEAQLKDTRA